ncbi:hypothetical protein [Polaribacter sp.]|uniref:hypothetical protein n=1 Tax=Polaribacter sp. TaxID=1920175 RepID=UPI003F6CF1A1
MNFRYYIAFLVFVFSACDKEKQNQKKSSNLQVDHFNIWTESPKLAKEKLINLGFIALPDSLSKVHHGQGTTGRYFYFLNNYLELIYVNDQKEFEENNAKNKNLDFSERANFKNNGASPFGIALKVKDYNTNKIPFKKIAYHQDWMTKNANIYAAKSSKNNLKEPSVFVVYPEIESDQFESLADLQKIPEEYSFYRTLFKHPNGAKKVSQITITSPQLDTSTPTIKALNGIENVLIKKGSEHVMELYFDKNFQKKIFDLRPELPLIIYL